MPLAAYKPPTRTVPLGDGNSIIVRGLSLDDTGRLVSMHRDAIEAVFIRFMIESNRAAEGEGWTERITVDFVINVLAEAPLVASSVISYAADEPDAFEQAMLLPMPVQIAALKAIGELTFTDEATIKKIVADVQEIIASLNPTVSTMSTPASMMNGAGADTSMPFTEAYEETPVS